MSMSGQQAVLAPVSRFADRAYLAWAAVATAYAIAFLQRVSPQSVSLNFMHDFSTDAAGVAMLASSYFWGYTLMQIPAGLLVDRYGVKRVVHTSTVTVYGDTPDGPLDESAPRKRTGFAYADSKIEAEETALGYLTRGLSVAVVQPFMKRARKRFLRPELEVTDCVASYFPVLRRGEREHGAPGPHRLDHRRMRPSDFSRLDVKQRVPLKRSVIGAVDRTRQHHPVSGMQP